MVGGGELDARCPEGQVRREDVDDRRGDLLANAGGAAVATGMNYVGRRYGWVDLCGLRRGPNDEQYVTGEEVRKEVDKILNLGGSGPCELTDNITCRTG